VGILVTSTSVREAAKPRLKTAHESVAKDPATADQAAAGDASDVEAASRQVSINTPVLIVIVAFLAFIIGAGIFTEAQKLPDWGSTLKNVFGVLWPLVLGYFGGEFVGTKTK
jgi:hypothetical protein